MPTPAQIPGKVSVGEQIAADGTVIQQPATNVVAPPAASPLETKVEAPPPADKVEQPKTEVVEQPKEEGVVDFSEFLDVKNITTKETPKPAGEKVDEAGGSKILPEQRDYSDIPEEDKAIFKNMSNEAFAKIKPMYLEQKKKDEELAAKNAEVVELKKGKIPDSYFEHPNAVVLTPEFEQASASVNYAAAIEKHWEEQFDKVKAGEATYQTIHINDKTGELFVSEPIQVDKTTETKLLKYVTWAQNQTANTQARLNGVIQGHKQKHSESVNWVKDYEKKAFSVFDKEDSKELRAIVEDTVKNFPAAHRNNPLVGMLAKSMVMNMLLGKQLQAKGGGTVTPAKTVTKTNGNLSAAEIAGEGAGGKVEVKLGDSFEDFEKYKQGIPI